MRRSRGYILTEMMMSMLLQAMFIVVLSGAFYMMLNFYTKTQQMQTARERGHSVISYVDQRIKHAGLGLWQCKSSKEIKNFLSTADPITTSSDLLPVLLVSNDNYCPKDGDNSIFIGNIVTILYAYKDFGSSSKFILKDEKTVSRNNATEFSLMNGQGLTASGFTHTGNTNTSNTYTVAEGAGIPLRINSITEADNKIEFKLDVDVTNASTSIVYAGSELLHMGCERMFVKSSDNLENRSFAFAFPESTQWSNPYYHVSGILDIYMELNTNTRTFDLYVLSTGGKDDSGTAKSHPASWPSQAHWDTEYGKHVLYVSRASWKLNNIPKDFKFSYNPPNQ